MTSISITILLCNYSNCLYSELNQSWAVGLGRVSFSSSRWKQASVCLPVISSHLQKTDCSFLVEIVRRRELLGQSVMMSTSNRRHMCSNQHANKNARTRFIFTGRTWQINFYYWKAEVCDSESSNVIRKVMSNFCIYKIMFTFFSNTLFYFRNKFQFTWIFP